MKVKRCRPCDSRDVFVELSKDEEKRQMSFLIQLFRSSETFFRPTMLNHLVKIYKQEGERKKTGKRCKRDDSVFSSSKWMRSILNDDSRICRKFLLHLLSVSSLQSWWVKKCLEGGHKCNFCVWKEQLFVDGFSKSPLTPVSLAILSKKLSLKTPLKLQNCQNVVATPLGETKKLVCKYLKKSRVAMFIKWERQNFLGSLKKPPRNEFSFAQSRLLKRAKQLNRDETYRRLNKKRALRHLARSTSPIFKSLKILENGSLEFSSRPEKIFCCCWLFFVRKTFFHSE